MRQREFLHVDPSFFSPFSLLSKEFEKEVNANPVMPQLLETDDAFLASYDIPGVNSSEINIEIEEDLIIIFAERKNPFDKTGKLVKKYSQSFLLPKNADLEKISAHYENGVLSLTIPKLEDQKHKKKIQVITGEKPKNWASFLNFGKRENENVIN